MKKAVKTRYITNTEIEGMTYNQIGKKLTTGELTEKRLKDYYVSARKKAMGRTKRVSKTSEFGQIEEEYFRKVRDLPTTSDLVHEIAGVNKYLRGYKSTITGLKEHRERVLNQLERHGFSFIDESNFADWERFMIWFKSSEYTRFFDSTDEEVEEAFTMAEGATPEEWSKAFDMFIKGNSNENYKS